MPTDTDHHSDQRIEGSGRRPRAPRPLGSFLAAGRASADAAGLAADPAALVDAGLIRRVHADGEIRFELTELGQSSPSAEA
jgi:hypothetical protein